MSEVNLISWLIPFDARQIQEIRLCRLYKDQFAHGTSGHNEKLIIATMAEMLEQVCIDVEASKETQDLGLKIRGLVESWRS